MTFPNGTLLGKVLNNVNKPYPYDYAVGDYYMMFQYVDRDVNMTGTTQYTMGTLSAPDADTTVIQYDIHYKKGWNRIVNEVIVKTSHVTTHRRIVRNVNEGDWFLDS